MRLADHSGVSNVVSLVTTNNEFRWAGDNSGLELVFEVDSGSFTRDAKLGSFYTILNLCIRSRGMDLDAGTIASNSNFNFNDSSVGSEKAVYNSGDPFEDVTSNWPRPTSPWISAVAIETDASASRRNGTFDIISKLALQVYADDYAFIYGDEIEQLAARNKKIEVNVFEIPYIQIKLRHQGRVFRHRRKHMSLSDNQKEVWTCYI